MPGGQVGIRGYLVQTLIALLDVLDDVQPWISVTLEPSVESDKVDILWRYENTTKAVQVKSSQNPFRRADVGRWAEGLKAWRDADSYELVLVGTAASPPEAQIRIALGVQIRQENLNLRAFKEQAAHRLDRFLQQQGLACGNADYREMLAGAVAEKLTTLSTEGAEYTKADLVQQLTRWIPPCPESVESTSTPQIEPIAAEIGHAVSALYRRLFEEPTARGVKRILYEAERLPKDEPDVRLLIDDLTQALTAPAIAFGIILGRLAFVDRVQAAEALGYFGDPRIDLDSPDYWVTIPAGIFLMGAQSKNRWEANYDEQAEKRESPVHKVTYKAYQVARYPVTVGQYGQFIEAGGYRDRRHWAAGGFTKYKKPEEWEQQLEFKTRPVIGVSWYEAAAFCAWGRVRLLTEAEWERAARGTTGRKYPWGSEPPDERRTNFNKNIGHPTPIGVYPLGRTPDGVYDKAGNVWEWCQDWYEDYKPNEASDPVGPSLGSLRVFRGGSWNFTAEFCRSAYRYRITPEYRDLSLGFRVARSPSGK